MIGDVNAVAVEPVGALDLEGRGKEIIHGADYVERRRGDPRHRIHYIEAGIGAA